MKIHKLFILPLILFSALVSCNDDDDQSENSNLNNQAILDDVIQVLGGLENINNADYISYNSTGIAYEFQENPEPIGGKVADFSYELTYNLSGAQSKQHWMIQTEYAYESDLDFIETIDHKKGTSEGITGFFSENFGGFGVEGDPMFSTKIAARQKTLMMSSPLAIIKMMVSEGINTTENGILKVGYNTSSLGFGSNTPDLGLVIDSSTNLPSKVQVLENDPLLGDVIYEVIYSDWTSINGMQLPRELVHKLDGNTIRTETISNIEINPTDDYSELAVDASDWQYDIEQAKYGHLSSQFHFRTLMQTFAIDFPVEYVDQTSPLALPSELVGNDNNVFRVSGDFQSHYTYAFKVNDELVLYDSPINNRRSAVVLEKIQSSFSTDPIKYVVHSHNHFDHTGGVRGNLAEGGDLIVGEGSRSFMQDVLQRPHNVLPNPLNNNVDVIGVSDEMTIGTGSDEIVLYTLPTEHAENEDYIVVYKPSTQTLYLNDLYNSGFIFVYDNLSPQNQDRLVRLAQDVVNFVDSKGISVNTYYCTHGFTTMDFDFQTIRNLAAM